jgi:hypothetical protein
MSKARGATNYNSNNNVFDDNLFDFENPFQDHNNSRDLDLLSCFQK